MAQITPAMLDKAALKAAGAHFGAVLADPMENWDVAGTICAYLNAMVASEKAVIEDREDWENSLQSIKRSTFLVIKLKGEP